MRKEKQFASWRVQFPRPAAAAVGATEEGGISAEAGSSGAGNAQGSAGGGATPPTLAPGTQADSEAVLKEKLGTKSYLKNLCPEVVLVLPVR